MSALFWDKGCLKKDQFLLYGCFKFINSRFLTFEWWNDLNNILGYDSLYKCASVQNYTTTLYKKRFINYVIRIFCIVYHDFLWFFDPQRGDPNLRSRFLTPEGTLIYKVHFYTRGDPYLETQFRHKGRPLFKKLTLNVRGDTYLKMYFRGPLSKTFISIYKAWYKGGTLSQKWVPT